MISRFFLFLHNFKIRTKLFLIYFFSSALAVLLLGVALNSSIGKRLFSHERDTLGNSLRQGISQLEISINDTLNLANFIHTNDALLSACNTDYGTDYFKMYLSYNNHILPNLNIYKCLIPEVPDIRIYTSCDLVPYMGVTDHISEPRDPSWFPVEKLGPGSQWCVLRHPGRTDLFYTSHLPQTPVYPLENHLCLKVNYDFFFAGMESITQEEYGLVIADKDQTVLYQYSSFPEGHFPIDCTELVLRFSHLSEEYSDRFLFLNQPVTSTGWTVYYYSPVHTIRQAAEQTILTTFLLVALCFVTLYCFTFLTVNSILSPLSRLTKMIETISLENIGNHEFICIPSRHDEIGTLIHTFNRMMKRMRLLIDEAYVQKLKVKEYQFNALRAQINPHFLYNTLSMISGKAIISGQNDISETVRLLALFYRTSLNGGQDITTIEKEIENIQAYISIQMTLTDRSFQVEYHLDRTFFDWQIPCLILQPLVENAIEHGFRNCRRRDKLLRIQLSGDEKRCHILISDNGTGIPKDKIEQLYTRQPSHHIGIRNVNERLKLFFGYENGLHIQSAEGKGTLMEISILPFPR